MAKLQYLQVQKRRYVEFWRGRVSHPRTNQNSPSAFSHQIRNNSKKDKTKSSQMMGWIKNRPNKFLNQNFVRQGLPAKCKSLRFRFISLICCRQCCCRIKKNIKCSIICNLCRTAEATGRHTNPWNIDMIFMYMMCNDNDVERMA